jgi:hypothetical protein
VGAAAAALALTLTAVPAQAIETGAPPQLPPPPPPPITQSPPAPAAGGSKPASAAPRSTAASSSSAGASASTSSSVSETSGGSSGSALDTRIALAGMLGVSTDCLGFGLGARGGKTWDNHLYIGGSFVYHFPGCGYANFGPVAGNYSSSASAFYFGPEGGYDFDLKAVVLRAYMGLGLAFFSASVSGPGIPNGSISSSSNQFVVWPGASVIWDVPGSPWFIGGDVRFVSVPAGPAVGFFFWGGIHLGS